MMNSLLQNRFGKFDALVLAIICVGGLINLPVPFHGDQALFTIGAVKMHHGAVLYRDFWDLKQPGIYAFYLLAGTIFGFNEVGIHSFELLYMAAFSVVLIVTLKSYYQHAPVAALAALLTVGVYYGVAGSWHLTQVEGLVGFPLFLCLWFASGSPAHEGSRAWRFFLSGLMGGFVLLFKLMFLAILAGFYLNCLIDLLIRKREQRWIAVAQVCIPSLLGLLCPLLLAGAYFARVGVIGIVYKTFIEYPPRLLTELPPSGYGSLVDGLLWFSGKFAPLLSLGFVGACLSLSRRRDLVTTNMVLWCVLGFLVILLQRRSWWQYQYLLLLVPLGVLAALGLDVLWEHIKGLGPVLSPRKGLSLLVLSSIILFSPVIGSWCQKTVFLAYYRANRLKVQPLGYYARFNPAYSEIGKEVAFLTEPDSRPGGIFVCGNPIFYLLSGRDQAIALNGWALELYLPEQWLQLTEQLEGARPPYIFVDPAYAELIPERSAETMRFLKDNYQVLRHSDKGTWYALNYKRHALSHAEPGTWPLGSISQVWVSARRTPPPAVSIVALSRSRS